MFAIGAISGLIYVALLALSVRKPPRVDVETATQEDEMMHVWRAGNLRHTAYLCTDLESQGQSAVRSQGSAGNVTGFIGAKKDDRLGNLLGSARTSQVNALGED